MDDVFFGGWSGLVRTLIAGALAYLVMLVSEPGHSSLEGVQGYD